MPGSSDGDLRYGGDGGLPVPFPVWQGAKPYTKPYPNGAALRALVDDAPIKSVRLSGLTATQPTVSPAGVEKFLGGAKKAKGTRSPKGLLIDVPVLVEHEGKTYIHDGHHRIVAAVEGGKSTIKARTVTLETPKGSPMALWANASRDS